MESPSVFSSLSLSVLAQRIRIRLCGPAVEPLLVGNFGALSVPDSGARPDLDYRICCNGAAFSVARSRRAPRWTRSLADVLYLIEKSLAVELQRRRADLLFLHAAALEWQGKAFLFAAESGGGKSTLTWGLLHHGFGYLSDELAPVDADSIDVHAYPHALCLKQPPPAYPMPDAAIHLGRTIHVPVTALPGPLRAGPLSVAAIFFLRYEPQQLRPALHRIKSAEAVARLYVSALNALAHPDRGLAPALAIVRRVPCFAVTTAALAETCQLIRQAVSQDAPC